MLSDAPRHPDYVMCLPTAECGYYNTKRFSAGACDESQGTEGVRMLNKSSLYFVSVVSLLLTGTPVQAVDPYSFEVQILDQKVWLYDESLRDEDGFLAGQEVPIIIAPYTLDTPVSGVFSYDPTVRGIHANCEGLPAGPLSAACVNFGAAIPEISVAIGGDTFTRTLPFMVFADETGGPEPQNPLPGQDVLFSVSVFGTVLQGFDIEVDGVIYTSRSANIRFFEGPDGADFFPDSALSDSVEGGFSFSSATLPPMLPPAGATVQRFTMNWDAGEIAPGITQTYSIYGTMTLNDGALMADINVNPYSPANAVKPASDDPIVVAVHSTSVAAGDASDFDALQVDPDTLKFGLGEAANIAVVPWVVDADSDGEENDALFVFKTQSSGIFCNDTNVSLTGETYSGAPFAAVGPITTPDCTDLGCHPPAE
jgi:hypothetical protein